MTKKVRRVLWYPLKPKPGLTPISCHAVLERSTCAPFIKERRMECINATSHRRKSGQGGTQPSLPVKQVSSSTCGRWGRVFRRGRCNGLHCRSGRRGSACACIPRTCARRDGASSDSNCCAGRKGLHLHACS